MLTGSRSRTSVVSARACRVSMPRPAATASVTPLTESTLPIQAVLAVSPRGFIVIWWLIQGAHVVFIVFSVYVIKLHRFFDIEDMQATIAYMGSTVIGFFNAVIIAHCVLVACHTMALLQSVWWSLYHGQWRFAGQSKNLHRRHIERRHTVIKQTLFSTESTTGAFSKHSIQVAAGSKEKSLGRRLLSSIVQTLRRVVLALFGRFGIFGVEGTHYESAFFALEVVEIALQAFQAYKLSQLVPHVWINRLNAVVLIINCWSTMLVHQFLHCDRLTKRVLLLVVDGLFDTISSTLIPLVIIYLYIQEFDVTRRDFPLVNYYSDV